MKLSILIMLAASVVIFGAPEAMAVEEPSYKVLKKTTTLKSATMRPSSLPKQLWKATLNRLKRRRSAGYFAIFPGRTVHASKLR